MTAPSRLVGCGIAKETTFGVPVTAAYLLPVQPPAPVDNVAMLDDNAWRGSPVAQYQHTPGVIDGSIDLSGPVFADTIGFPLAGVLGDVVFTGGAPNQHAISLLTSGTQQPPSYTVTTWDSINALQWPGCKFSDFTIGFAGDGLLTWSAHLAGLDAVIGSVPGIAASSVPMFAGWRGVVKLGGSVETHVLSGEISISRPVSAKRTADGVQAPYLQRSEEITVAGKLLLAMAADTYRAQYVAGTQTSVDVNYQQGAGGTATGVQLHCSNVFLTAAAKSYGSRWVELEAEFAADGNTTDVGASGGYSPIKATLKNAVASGIYA